MSRTPAGWGRTPAASWAPRNNNHNHIIIIIIIINNIIIMISRTRGAYPRSELRILGGIFLVCGGNGAGGVARQKHIVAYQHFGS